MKKKYLTFSVAVICILAMLTACGNTTTTDATAESETETALESESKTEKPETEPEETATETDVTETADPAETESTDSVEPTETETPVAQYTYTDLSETRYAKSSVNVRDLPSTDGNRVGGLSTNQEVTVTGQCNETGWYRIKLNGADAYVSNNYLVTEKVPVGSASAGGSTLAGNTGTGNSSVGGAITNPATGKPYTTEELRAMSSEERNALLQQAMNNINGGSGNETYVPQGEVVYERAWGEAIFAMINEERKAAGIHELVWDENLYEIAKQRCDEDDNHNSVRPGTGENYGGAHMSAEAYHNAWKASSGHHGNYMNTMYTTGAVAIKVTYDSEGIVASVGYEVFGGITSARTESAARTDIAPQAPTGIVDESADTHQNFTNSKATTGMTADEFREKLRQENEARHKANGADGF